MTVPTVAMMTKKAARPTAEKASGKKEFKRCQVIRAEHFPPKDELLIDAGYAHPTEQCIDELLELAGADKRPLSRRDLLNALQLARMSYEAEKDESSRQRPPSKQMDQLERSIEKTCVLLRRIRRYDDFRNIGFVTQQIGRGVVAVGVAQGLARKPSISDQELICPTFDGQVAAMNVEPLLRATLLRVRRLRRHGRGAPKNLAKESVVFYAAQYFREHSPTKPSTDLKNPFHEFAERFYEVVTKTKPGSLDRQKRRVFSGR
jgi:hypothetical protein